MITDLSWGEQTSLEKLAQHKVDVIVGSELAYDVANIKLLIKTI
jgi:ABC-type Fe3+-hydroxamate transport system substrate-binding protein